ncbi:MAG: acylphosphatase [Methanomethylovorans sp.]|uniref:acylphosphatase n=1 Tax=Methanomethylovorans sp. TaxID=2758717 RepID=UPI0026122AB1|nr:acylphosphatase [Methanomethylovorans sp.]
MVPEYPSMVIGNVLAEVHVCGRVQGVFFRQFTKNTAQELGIAGYARNLSDGCVQVLAEGSKESVELLLQRLKVGPPMSRVDSLKVEWKEALGEFNGFVIKR